MKRKLNDIEQALIFMLAEMVFVVGLILSRGGLVE